MKKLSLEWYKDLHIDDQIRIQKDAGIYGHDEGVTESEIDSFFEDFKKSVIGTLFTTNQGLGYKELLTCRVIKIEKDDVHAEYVSSVNVDENDILMSMPFSLLELISEKAFYEHKNDVISNEKKFTEKELPIEAMFNLIGFINNPIGRRKYPKEVLDNVQDLEKWIKENIKIS